LKEIGIEAVEAIVGVVLRESPEKKS